jgi:uncharacterized protein
MPHHFAKIAFTPKVKRMQEEMGSRAGYARLEDLPESMNGRIGAAESAFIAARNSFYMGTVSETGWPYVQHRGGPTGFVRVLDEQTVGFADFRGNRQYVTVGNLIGDDRVSLFFMDYPNKTRLKMFGRARIIGAEDEAMLSLLESPAYRARIERGIVIAVEGFDWNCPQHIVERYTSEEMGAEIERLRDKIAKLETVLEQHPAPPVQ